MAASYHPGVITGKATIRQRSEEELHNISYTVLLDSGDTLNVAFPLNNNVRGLTDKTTDLCKSKGKTNREWFGEMHQRLLGQGVPFTGAAFEGKRVSVMFSDAGDPVGVYPDSEILGDEIAIAI